MQSPNTPPIETTIDGLRSRTSSWRRSGARIALVPTMGALHEGHLALVDHARDIADNVVVSIFVNPAQFAEGEDFPTYPRDLDGDVAKLSQRPDAIFAPPVEEIYPDGFATKISVGGPSNGLETDFRPGFFTGVATVVTKLLLAVAPDIAVFGEKDYQQLLVIRRLVADLGLPVEIASYPIVREEDGLALSSRNAYLTAEERQTAPELYRVLSVAAEAIRGGELALTATEEARSALRSIGFDVDYVELRSAETLEPVSDQTSEPMRLLAAVRLGHTRLIDNVPV